MTNNTAIGPHLGPPNIDCTGDNQAAPKTTPPPNSSSIDSGTPERRTSRNRTASSAVKPEQGGDASLKGTALTGRPSTGPSPGGADGVAPGGVLAARGVYMLRDFRGIQEMKEQVGSYVYVFLSSHF